LGHGDAFGSGGVTIVDVEADERHRLQVAVQAVEAATVRNAFGYQWRLFAAEWLPLNDDGLKELRLPLSYRTVTRYRTGEQVPTEKTLTLLFEALERAGRDVPHEVQEVLLTGAREAHELRRRLHQNAAAAAIALDLMIRERSARQIEIERLRVLTARLTDELTVVAMAEASTDATAAARASQVAARLRAELEQANEALRQALLLERRDIRRLRELASAVVNATTDFLAVTAAVPGDSAEGINPALVVELRGELKQANQAMRQVLLLESTDAPQLERLAIGLVKATTDFLAVT
jgi:hypothetical protein